MEKHVSVLLSECIEALSIKPDAIYVDGTAGGGGHSLEIIRRLGSGRLIAIDRDAFAIQKTADRLQEFSDKLTLVQDNYCNLKAVLDGQGISEVQGILLDLGVSSFQLDQVERGFSYQNDAPIDMRMDQGEAVSAKDIVNTFSERELSDIIYRYGEEKFSGRIARALCTAREKAPIETTGQLAELIKTAIPAATRRQGPHPAKRTFQALRIAVNREIELLEGTVRDCLDVLAPGGVLAIITFHSLEDRIVKTVYTEAADPCICPRDFPVCTCGRVPRIKMSPRKAILPSAQEIEENPRSRSAKLRVAIKL